LIGDCTVIFQKRYATSIQQAMGKLGADVDLLYRDLPNVKHFGKEWCILNLFLRKEGMVI